jgi:hypothetical protein
MALVDTSGNLATRLRANLNASGSQGQPDVAISPSGQILVVWRDGTDIRMRRFSPAGIASSEDADAQLNGAGSCSDPVVASSSSGQELFAVGWVMANGQIRGRLISGQSGFLANSVDGLEHDFEVSRADIAGKRSQPSVAIGGSGYIVYAWQDDSDAHSGIYGRRFPLP